MKRTMKRSAMRFASVAYLDQYGMLDITFENGDRFLLATEILVAEAHNGAAIKWSKLRIGETGDVIEVPNRTTPIEIPWDRIRSVADPEFRAHLNGVAKERARQLGKRIRAMRLSAKVTRAQLAERIDRSAEEIADLETGKAVASIDFLERIALALGKRLRDFAVE